MASNDKLCLCGNMDIFMYHCMFSKLNDPLYASKLHEYCIDGHEINAASIFTLLDYIITKGELSDPKPTVEFEESPHEKPNGELEHYRDVYYRYFKAFDPTKPALKMSEIKRAMDERHEDEDESKQPKYEWTQDLSCGLPCYDY